MPLTQCGTSPLAIRGPRSSSRPCAILAALAVFFPPPGLVGAQEPEAVVAKDAISVHRVERGMMILRETVTGSITSVTPARATVSLTAQQGAVVRLAQPCSIQVVAPAVLPCKVTQVRSDSALGVTTAELEVAQPFAPGTAIRDRVDALINVGTTDSIVYFERPASARPNSTSTIFVLEPDGQHAKRVSVSYGRLSGSQLEILSGLAPGDRVIVTDLPAVAGRDRVVLK
jgi:HlyD family secretion protein